jgi:steroid delta-isomerase-like uncharacterized protein
MKTLLTLTVLLAPALAAAQPVIVADSDDARENAALVARGIDAFFNRGDFTHLDEAVAEDYVEHEAGPDEAGGREGFRQFVTRMRTAFPDFRYELDEVIAAGDRIVLRGRMTGTHRGPFMDLAPTGRTIDVPVMDVLRMSDAQQVVEHWGMTDTMAMMQQLGAVPPEH